MITSISIIALSIACILLAVSVCYLCVTCDRLKSRVSSLERRFTGLQSLLLLPSSLDLKTKLDRVLQAGSTYTDYLYKNFSDGPKSDS